MSMCLCIDPGHGSDTKEKTGGKFSPITGMEEYEFNKGVAQYLMDLCDSVGIEYVNVSPENTDTPLYTRTQRANQYYSNTRIRPCVYVSIHANAGGGTGAEVWVHSRSIPSTISLADCVLKEICSTTGQRNRGVKKGFVSNPNADFHVNRETNMVSMLVEYGFMDSNEDCDKLLDESFRKQCAVATLQGLLKAYGKEIPDFDIPSTPDKDDSKYKKLYEQEKLRADKAEATLEQIRKLL